jgi:S1-C subfamily serine protease
MVKWLRGIALGVALLMTGACVSFNWVPESMLVSQLAPLSVTVHHRLGGGSGVWIGEDLVLTAKHVVLSYDGWREDIHVVDLSGYSYPAKVIVFEKEPQSFIQHDWVILRVEGAERQNWARPDCGSRYVGEKVIGFGNGHLYTGLLPYMGVIQTVKYNPSALPNMKTYWGDAILTTLDGAPGVSGGPVFDMEGDLIGMMVGAFQDRRAGSFQQITYPVRHIEIMCP